MDCGKTILCGYYIFKIGRKIDADAIKNIFVDANADAIKYFVDAHIPTSINCY